MSHIDTFIIIAHFPFSHFPYWNIIDYPPHLFDSFSRYLIEEGNKGHPKMMSVGLHCRLVGRPGRAAGLKDFLDFVKSCGDDVWVCRRDDIAKHWYKNHYPKGYGEPPNVDHLGGMVGTRSSL